MTTTVYVLVWRTWVHDDADDYDSVIGAFVDADSAKAHAQEIAIEDANAEQTNTGVLVEVKPLQWHHHCSMYWSSVADYDVDDGFFDVIGTGLK